MKLILLLLLFNIFRCEMNSFQIGTVFLSDKHLALWQSAAFQHTVLEEKKKGARPLVR